jgi:hypothetical protein
MIKKLYENRHRYKWAVIWYYKAVKNHPKEIWCGWCKMRPTMYDDIGWWIINPNGDGDRRPCCEKCWKGKYGQQHRDRYGVGER